MRQALQVEEVVSPRQSARPYAVASEEEEEVLGMDAREKPVGGVVVVRVLRRVLRLFLNSVVGGEEKPEQMLYSGSTLCDG